jgi:hypothetical protein
MALRPAQVTSKYTLQSFSLFLYSFRSQLLMLRRGLMAGGFSEHRPQDAKPLPLPSAPSPAFPAVEGADRLRSRPLPAKSAVLENYMNCEVRCAVWYSSYVLSAARPNGLNLPARTTNWPHRSLCCL